MAGPAQLWQYRCIIIIVTNSTLYLWSCPVLISRHPRFYLVPPQGLVQFPELYEKHTCLWLPGSYLKRKQPVIVHGQDAVLLRIPFVQTEKLQGAPCACLHQPHRWRKEEAVACRFGLFDCKSILCFSITQC